MTSQPRFRRRKQARPGEIVEAAVAVFSEKGFAAARLEDIAARAGVSKGAIYLYFANKEELFHAVVTRMAAPNIGRVRTLAETQAGGLREVLPLLPSLMAHLVTATPVGAIFKIVIGESRNFPELARHWRQEVVEPMLGLITGLIAAAQARGEVRPGDPRHYALQFAGPMILGVLWREVLVPVGAEPVDIHALATQHVETMLRALLVDPETGR